MDFMLRNGQTVNVAVQGDRLIVDFRSFETADILRQIAPIDKAESRKDIVWRVRYARTRRGFSQRGFAKAIGMTSGNWSKTENAKQSISMDLLFRINDVLKLDIRYYFGQLCFEEAVGLEE